MELDTEPGASPTEPGDPTTSGGVDEPSPVSDGTADQTTGSEDPPPSACQGIVGTTPLGSACIDDCDCDSGNCFELPLGRVCSECATDAECVVGGEADTCTVDPTTDPPFARCTAATGGASLSSTRCEDLDGVAFDDAVTMVHGVTISAKGGSASATARREHARISQGLADELGIDQDAVSSSGPARQLRVTLEDVAPNLSANFTVAEIDAGDPGLRLDVWLPDGGNDDDGFDKLFDGKGTGVLDDEPKATVHLYTPDATKVVSDGVTTSHNHFSDPDSSDGTFHECVELHDDTLAVITPHGGDIERHITDEFPGLLSTLEELGESPSVWQAIGLWNGGSAHRQWHITATQISAESFPGYALLADAGPYKYTLVLHGYGSSQRGVVVGGRASRQVKCFLVQQLEQARSVSTNIGYKIYAPDGPPVELNGSVDRSGLTGQSVDNIVNRLSSTEAGAGGIQLEMSTGLRDDTETFTDFMHALGIAAHELVELQLTAEPTTDYCSMI